MACSLIGAQCLVCESLTQSNPWLLHQQFQKLSTGATSTWGTAPPLHSPCRGLQADQCPCIVTVMRWWNFLLSSPAWVPSSHGLPQFKAAVHSHLKGSSGWTSKCGFGSHPALHTVIKTQSSYSQNLLMLGAITLVLSQLGRGWQSFH